jgi:hypothetical protein
MGILASIIPGLRSLRTPVASGLLWLAVVAVYLLEHGFHLRVDKATVDAVNSLLPDWFGIAVIPVILTVAYLLGSVMNGLTNPLVSFLVGTYRRVARTIRDPENINTRNRYYRARSYLARHLHYLAWRAEEISLNAHGLIMDYVTSSFTVLGAPGSAVLMFPFEMAEERLPRSAGQLSQTAPSQYQEYDRLQAEAEFRTAFVPPLLVISFELPFPHHWAYVLGISIASCVLLTQSVSLTRKSNDMLATAALMGFLVIPEVKSVASFVSELQAKNDGGINWTAAIIVGLDHGGFFDEAEEMIIECTNLDGKDAILSLYKDLASSDAALGTSYRERFEELVGVSIGDYDEDKERNYTSPRRRG